MPEKIIYKEFSKQLKKIQKEKNITGASISKKLSIPRSTYNSYERGIAFPPPDIIVKIKEALDISFEELFEPYLLKDTKRFDKIIGRIKKIYDNPRYRIDLEDQIYKIELKMRDIESQKKGGS